MFLHYISDIIGFDVVYNFDVVMPAGNHGVGDDASGGGGGGGCSNSDGDYCGFYCDGICSFEYFSRQWKLISFFTSYSTFPLIIHGSLKQIE